MHSLSSFASGIRRAPINGIHGKDAQGTRCASPGTVGERIATIKFARIQCGVRFIKCIEQTMGIRLHFVARPLPERGEFSEAGEFSTQKVTTSKPSSCFCVGGTTCAWMFQRGSTEKGRQLPSASSNSALRKKTILYLEGRWSSPARRFGSARGESKNHQQLCCQ